MVAKVGGAVLGVLGAALALAGAVSLALKPAADVSVPAALDASTLVIPPDMVALAADGDIVVTGTGEIYVHTARPADAYGWANGDLTALVAGVESWDLLEIQYFEGGGLVAEPEPAASPSPSASPGAAATPASASDATPSPSPSASPAAAPEIAGAGADADVWRTSTSATNSVVLKASDLAPGEAVVVVAEQPLAGVSIAVHREVGFGWAWPLLVAGALLMMAALVWMAIQWLDLRPASARAEEGIARMRKRGATEPEPGSRRSRRGTTVLDAPAEPGADSKGGDA